ncbi:MAG: N-acetylglucosamine-6-phosphate deacetylase [Candidatus Limnocylindria bacterium]
MSADPLLLRGLGLPTAGLDGPTALLVADGRIAATDGDAESGAGDARTLDCTGLAAVPGFIELQVNGIAGRDFTTDPAAMWEVGAVLARYGVTAFLPTIVTSPRGSVEAALHAWSAGSNDAIGAVPLGLHVEGPYLAPGRTGAHPRDLLRAPDLDELRGWLGTDALRILTLAPELPDATRAIEMVAGAGAVASVGHTDADAPTAQRAVEAGARYATHLFNAMPPLLHRAPGAAGALLADERVTVGLVVDGHHLAPLMVGLVARLAPQRVSLVSDAIAGLGLPDGPHRLGDRTVTVGEGAARLPDGTLAGSVVALDACVRGMANASGSASLAVDAVTVTPARLLGLADGRGGLVVGGRADVTLLDRELQVRATIVAGNVVHAGDGLAWH